MRDFLFLAAIVLSLAVFSGQAGAGEPIPSHKYAPFTLVIYNKNVDESRKLAAHYAKVRAIPLDNLIGLDAPDKEIITRAEYEETVQKPLRAMFDANGWWECGKDAQGLTVPLKNKMKIAALMYGMPLKIARTPPKPTGELDPKTGKPVKPKLDHRTSDGASLDSEIMTLGVDYPNLVGPGKNPYFSASDAFGMPSVLLTARIDGPSYEVAKRLIDDAVAVEKTGLWGTAAVDIANLAATKGPGYKTGDQWLENCAMFYRKAGIPVTVERTPARFPPGYPMGKDVVMYWGWYSRNAEGPFRDPAFKFKKGAIACHLHSYSANTLRHTRKNWCGPLLTRGACATFGNVYEPFLTMSLHFDLCNARLLGGFTLVEAHWMATPVVSWMQVCIGDPLYQPFRRAVDYDTTTDADFKAFRVAVRQWGNDLNTLTEKLQAAAVATKSAKLVEATGLQLLEEKHYQQAANAFATAKRQFTEPADKLRQDLHVARLFLAQEQKTKAVTLLRSAAKHYQAIPEAKAAVAMANQLDPPPPPPPAPAAAKPAGK